jgi:hypothetical protein
MLHEVFELLTKMGKEEINKNGEFTKFMQRNADSGLDPNIVEKIQTEINSKKNNVSKNDQSGQLKKGIDLNAKDLEEFAGIEGRLDVISSLTTDDMKWQKEKNTENKLIYNTQYFFKKQGHVIKNGEPQFVKIGNEHYPLFESAKELSNPLAPTQTILF